MSKSKWSIFGWGNGTGPIPDGNQSDPPAHQHPWSPPFVRWGNQRSSRCERWKFDWPHPSSQRHAGRRKDSKVWCLKDKNKHKLPGSYRTFKLETLRNKSGEFKMTHLWPTANSLSLFSFIVSAVARIWFLWRTDGHHVVKRMTTHLGLVSQNWEIKVFRKIQETDLCFWLGIFGMKSLNLGQVLVATKASTNLANLRWTTRPHPIDGHYFHTWYVRCSEYFAFWESTLTL